MPRLLITIHKARGEDRERGADGLLHATRNKAWFASLRPSAAGPPLFRSQIVTGSAGKIRRRVEEMFGPLNWRGTPDIEGMYGMAEIHVEVR